MVSMTTKKIKGDFIRIETRSDPERPTGMEVHIENNRTGEDIILWPVSKTYKVKRKSDEKEGMEMTVQSLKKTGVITAVRPLLEPTGKSEMMNGYQADIYTCAIPSRTSTYWLAQDLAKFVPLLAASHKLTNTPIEKQLPDPATFPGVPVHTVLEQSIGGLKVTVTTDLVSLKEENLSDSEFQVPPDYKKVK